MKKNIFILAIIVFIGGISLRSCKSDTDKKEDAIENVNEAKQDLKEVEADEMADEATKANDEEWQTYKAESDKTIMANETRILELRKAMNKPGTTFDKSYENSINTMEEKNIALQKRIINYENNQTDWESFKREFNSDTQVLATAFKNLTSNNKK